MEYLEVFDYIDNWFAPCICFLLYICIVLFILYGKNMFSKFYDLLHTKKISIRNKNIKNPLFIKRKKNKGIFILTCIILVYITNIIRKYILFLFPIELMTSHTNMVLIYSGEEALANIWACFPELDIHQLSLFIIQYGESISINNPWDNMSILITFFALLFYIGLAIFIFNLIKRNKKVCGRAIIISFLSILLYFCSTISFGFLYGKEVNQYTNYTNISYANGKIYIDDTNKYYYDEIIKMQKEREKLLFGGTFFYDLGYPFFK